MKVLLMVSAGLVLRWRGQAIDSEIIHLRMMAHDAQVKPTFRERMRVGEIKDEFTVAKELPVFALGG